MANLDLVIPRDPHGLWGLGISGATCGIYRPYSSSVYVGKGTGRWYQGVPTAGSLHVGGHMRLMHQKQDHQVGQPIQFLERCTLKANWVHAGHEGPLGTSWVKRGSESSSAADACPTPPPLGDIPPEFPPQWLLRWEILGRCSTSPEH